MRRTMFSAIICLFMILITSSAVLSQNKTASQQNELEPFLPYKTDNPPVIDGVLDDAVWQEAPWETGFKTYTPDYNINMVENTKVYYAYDRENLYFAFKCYDSMPDKIKASVTSRDNIYTDDWICINLDSFNDHQSLYCFYVNPFGIQGDSRGTATNEDRSIDIVWYSAGKIDKDGYSVELKVPFKSIRFSHKEPVEMGVIFERIISRRSEAGTYPALDPRQGPNFLTQTRTLVYNDIKHYRLFEVLPAVTYGRNSAIDKGDMKFTGDNSDISLTAKYGLTSHMILDGTYNPDFSQVEADAGQIDLNQRFPLYFEEKRPFFLEGREKFSFGGNAFGDPVGAIVHTRTIRDPIAGIKLNGKIGDKNTIASIYAVDELQEGDKEGDYANFAVLRYKRSLKQDSYIGGFYTGREVKNGHNRLIGSDGLIRLAGSSTVGYYGLLSRNEETGSNKRLTGHAAGFDYMYNTRKMTLVLGGTDTSEDFITKTGYYTRTGFTRMLGNFAPRFYPKSKIIRRIDPGITSLYTRDNIYDMNEYFNSFSLRFMMWRNSNITLRSRFANEIFLGQKFDTNNFNVSGGSQFTKQLFFFLSYTYGKKIRYTANPYQGRGTSANATVMYQPSDKMYSSLNISYSDFIRESDSVKEYDYTIVRSRNTYQVNKYLFFRGIFEYNSHYKILSTDFLASFTYIPGTVIHIGYGSTYRKLQWEDSRYTESDNFLEFNRGLFCKASYLWRL